MSSFISRKHISRRMVLKGMGVTVALPMLDAMVPAGTALAKTAAADVGLEGPSCRDGDGAWRGRQHRVRREEEPVGARAVGRDFDLSQTSLSPLEPFRNDLTIVSNTDVRNAEAFTLPEIGGDHFRSSAVFLTQSHPKQTEGNDVHAGTSMDQLYASEVRTGHADSVDAALDRERRPGGRLHLRLLVHLHRHDQLGVADAAAADGARPARRVRPVVRRRARRPKSARRTCRTDKSILDWVTTQIAQLRKEIGATDRARLDEYLDNIREIERRIQRVEARNAAASRGRSPRRRLACPTRSKSTSSIMMDLMALAFASDTTRVFSFKLGRDASGRSYPESGVTTGFHNASHHGEREERILEFAKINKYHVSMVPYLLEKLKNTPDGDGNLLDNSLILYGSPMADPNIHNHRRVPLFLAGHAGGRLKGGVHIKAPDGTPMANAMLTMLHALGRDDMQSFGDSTGELDLNTNVAGARERTDAAKG